MEVSIFNVAHGFCAYVVADNGNTLLLDCGHNDETGFYPDEFLLASGCSGIECFFVLNYDEDHLSGLPRLRAAGDRVPIHILHRNKSITGDQLRSLKRRVGALGPGIEALLEMIEIYTGGVVDPPEYPNLGFEVFHNSYPTFEDTNNLSLVLFLHYPGLSIIFPGDLEKQGWQALLQSQDFRSNLARVNIFVASHHGRESGYAREVFNFCSPDVMIISDEAKQYTTQETSYGTHAKGIPYNQTEVRRVLTTRKDGMISITKQLDSGYQVRTWG